jgi:hypothetical protein
MSFKKLSVIMLLVFGLLVLLAYLNETVFGIPVPERLVLVLFFLIGPVAIVGVMQFRKRLLPQYTGDLLNIATVFLIIAFSLLNLMLVVQQSLFAFHQKAIQGAADESTKESFRQAFTEVNSVQLGIDISWDIFYCIGVVLLSVVLLRLSLSWKILGIYGLITGLGLFVLNMWTFPVPPAEAGLIDLGPVSALFWLALIVIISFEPRKKTLSSPSDA